MSLNPIDYYDADKWDIPNEDRGVEQRERKAMSEIIKAVDGKKASILDIGCGDGLFLEALYAKIPESNRKKLKLFGVDYSHYKLKKAKKLKQPFTFDWCNLEERIPHKDGQFDVVHSGEVIEHIYNPDFMLEECRRVLKKDGLLIISTPNLINWYNRVLFLFGVQPLFYETSTKSSLIGAGPLAKIKKGSVPVGHLRVFNKTALKDMLEQEGFEVMRFHGAHFNSLPKAVRRVDNLFNIRPSMASILVVVARKK